MECGNTAELASFELKEAKADLEHESKLLAQSIEGIDPVESYYAEIIQDKECIADLLCDLADAGILADLFAEVVVDDGSPALFFDNARHCIIELARVKAEQSTMTNDGLYVAGPCSNPIDLMKSRDQVAAFLEAF